jgi:hypothetical protein
MNVLCNLPLECFEPRRCFRQRIVTFGPKERMRVDGLHYPFDLAFDPSRGTIEELWAALPRDFVPDVVLLYWPDQEPLPEGLERCPVPVVAVLSDYNLSLPYVAGLWPYFDVVLVDRSGVELLRRLSFADVRAFCQFSFKTHHRVLPGVRRDLDVAFAGNLNPVVQRERAGWIERVLRLRESGARVAVQSGVFGDGYAALLNRARIGWNRSIRGEMNLRAFEVPACGALLLMEEENLEVRDFFVPDEEVVLYGADDFEEVVRDLLADEPRRARIAAAGHRRVQEHRMSKRLDELERVLAPRGPGRPAATPFELALGRGVAMLTTWAPPDAAAQCLRVAARLAPDDPRAPNALALALLRSSPHAHAAQALALLQRACALAPRFVPSVINLGCLLEAAGRPDAARACTEELQKRLAAGPDFGDLDGPVLPLGFSERALAIARDLREAVLAGDPAGHLGAWAR